MGNAKVQLADGTTLIDLTHDDIYPGLLLSGIKAHDYKGDPIVGTASPRRNYCGVATQAGGAILIRELLVDAHLIVANCYDYSIWLIGYRPDPESEQWILQEYSSTGTDEHTKTWIVGDLLWPVSPDLAIPDGEAWAYLGLNIWGD